MIVLDTNVLSEIVKPAPSDRVLRWMSQQSSSDLFLTTITHAEILYGLAVLPSGKRKARLQTAFEGLFSLDFAGQILPFDEPSARHYAQLVSHRDSIGQPISQFDAQIAAMCLTHRATLATRNTADFEHLGLRLLNPWK